QVDAVAPHVCQGLADGAAGAQRRLLHRMDDLHVPPAVAHLFLDLVRAVAGGQDHPAQARVRAGIQQPGQERPPGHRRQGLGQVRDDLAQARAQAADQDDDLLGGHQRGKISLSISAHSRWPMNSCPSWMRGVSVDGTLKHTSQRPAMSPPEAPVKPITLMPFCSATSSARSTFFERPEVEMTTSTSPAWPSASTWRAKV